MREITESDLDLLNLRIDIALAEVKKLKYSPKESVIIINVNSITKDLKSINEKLGNLDESKIKEILKIIVNLSKKLETIDSKENENAKKVIVNNLREILLLLNEILN